MAMYEKVVTGWDWQFDAAFGIHYSSVGRAEYCEMAAMVKIICGIHIYKNQEPPEKTFLTISFYKQ